MSVMRMRKEKTFDVLGVDVAAVQIPDVITLMKDWIVQERGICHTLNFVNVYSVMRAREDLSFSKILKSATLNCPDGMPIVWTGRKQGFTLARRVYGPDLMEAFFANQEGNGYRHYFYGAAPGVAEKVAAVMKERYPETIVAGHYSPPFHKQTDAECREDIARINASNADLLWVGLGCPKQEMWMAEVREHLRVPCVLAVGQAFDIFAGTLPQAPFWMREHGLEWLFRLCIEPRRLWKRYLVYNSAFLFAMAKQMLLRR